MDAQIEAILFFKSEPISINALSKILHVGESEIKASLEILKEKLKGRGIALLSKNEEVLLGTTTEVSTLIEALIKEELSRDLGKAGLETLSAILYQGPITRAELDYIRGVNSTFILRNLLIRGLIEKIPNPKDQRSFLYRPTFELLAHMGITRVENLPEYDMVRSEIALFRSRDEAAIGMGDVATQTPEVATEQTERSIAGNEATLNVVNTDSE